MDLSEFNPIPENLENPLKTYFEVAQYAASQEERQNFAEANEANLVLHGLREVYKAEIFTREFVQRSNSRT